MPDYMIPFVPIIQEDEKPFAMFQDLQQKYGDWVLDVLRYDSADNLLKVLEKAVVKPALKKADELLMKHRNHFCVCSSREKKRSTGKSSGKIRVNAGSALF